MALPPPRLFDPSKDKSLIPQVAQIQADCITQDGQLATFLPPLDISRMSEWWLGEIEKSSKGQGQFIIQMATDDEVAGYVFLAMPWSQTGPFRGIVEKLMVSPKHRRKGVARRVMGKLEEVARQENRELLLLDTLVGSDAENVYPRLGYKSYGVVPKYGISPRDGKTLVDEIFFYKDLRDHPQ